MLTERWDGRLYGARLDPDASPELARQCRLGESAAACRGTVVFFSLCFKNKLLQNSMYPYRFLQEIHSAFQSPRWVIPFWNPLPCHRLPNGRGIRRQWLLWTTLTTRTTSIQSRSTRITITPKPSSPALSDSQMFHFLMQLKSSMKKRALGFLVFALWP